MHDNRGQGLFEANRLKQLFRNSGVFDEKCQLNPEPYLLGSASSLNVFEVGKLLLTKLLPSNQGIMIAAVIIECRIYLPMVRNTKRILSMASGDSDPTMIIASPVPRACTRICIMGALTRIMLNSFSPTPRLCVSNGEDDEVSTMTAPQLSISLCRLGPPWKRSY